MAEFSPDQTDGVAASPYDWAAAEIFPEPKRRFKEIIDATPGFLGGMAAATVILIGLGYAIEQIVPLFSTKAKAPPEILPPDVQKEVPSILKVEYNTNEGSGVKIASDLALTAGHVVLLPHNPAMQCSDSYTENKYTRPGHEDQIVTWQAANSGSSGDIALLKVHKDPNFAKLPAAPIAPHPFKKGETVFLINYESGSSKRIDRYPNTGEAQASQPNHYYSHPAELAGTVLGQEGSDYIIAANQRAYGPSRGRVAQLYPGASGGAVFDDNGNLGALSVAIEDSTTTVEDALITYQVQLPEPKARVVQLLMAQEVTPSLVHAYEHTLPKTHSC